MAADLDRLADRFKATMWVMLGLAAMLWLALSWKLAVAPALLSALSALTAKVLWAVAAAIEEKER